MIVGYNIVLPNGRVKKLRATDDKDRQRIVDEILEHWGGYCDRNWLSENRRENDPYCPENRVKIFLNGLSYFLMMGSTSGIVTDYKDIMNGKREIPISSCPSRFEDMLYGGGSTIQPEVPDEELSFQTTLEKLQNKASRFEKKKKEHMAEIPTKASKIQSIVSRHKECKFYYPIVNTHNEFAQMGKKHTISQAVSQYSPVGTRYGLLYDMDHIVCVALPDGSVEYYDMNYDAIPRECIVENNT